MATNQIVKIYELRSLGTDALLTELDNINARFAAIKKTVLDLKNQKTQTLIADPAEIAKLNDQLRQLAIEEAELKVRRAELALQAKQMQLLRAQELADQRAIANGNKLQQNSYNSLKAEIKTLYDLVKAAPKGADIITASGLVSYDEAIQKLKNLTAAEQDFRRQFQKDGTLVAEYTTGIVQAFERLGLGDVLKEQLNTAKGAITSLDAQFEVLRAELEKVRATGQGSLSDIERQLIENRRAALGLETQLNEMTAAMQGVGTIGERVSASLQEGFKNIRGQIAQVVLGYVGFQALLSGLQNSVATTSELADRTTNLEIELDKTAGGAGKLVNELAKLNTRTKLTDLESIANIAAKAGASEENLVGVAQAIDKIKVAFGKDFGDVEDGTESLVKIINIFEGADNVTGDNLLRTGNAIRTLANESVASVPFLNDFTQRMAGLKGMFDITLPSVLGLASGFENFGQSAEVSSTALVNIIPKLAGDVDKFAALVGVTREQFNQLINNNPTEAFLQVAQALVKTKGGVEEFSAAFTDSELGSGRVASIIGVAGKNADTFREKIALASSSIQSTANITSAFNAKNENLAATLDKISKKFADAAGSRGFQIILTAIAGLITLIINNLGIIIGVLTAYGAVLAIANAAQIKLWVSTQASNIAFRVQYATLLIAETFTKAYTASVNLLTGATQRSAAATVLLRAALTLLGIGAIIVLIAALAGAFNTASAAITGNMSVLRAQQQVMAEALRQTADARSKLDFYANVVRNTALAEDVRRKAMMELIKINPKFQDALSGNTINMQAFGNALKDVNSDLIKNAALQAAQANIAEANNEAIRLQQIKQKVQFQASQPGGVSRSDLTDDEIKDIDIGVRTYGRALVNARFDKFDLRDIFDSLDKKIAQAAAKAQAFSKVAEAKFVDLNKGTAGKADKTLAERAATEKLNAIELKQLIDNLDTRINLLKEGDPKIKELEKLQDSYQARLDAINGKTTPGTKGSRLSGETQDQFKDIEAAQKAAITALETRFNKGEVMERDYLLALQKINDDAARAKIAKLDGSNAAERQKRAELQLSIIKDQKDTNDKVYKLDLDALQARKDIADRAARETLNGVLENPASTQLQKDEAQQTFFNAQLENQKAYNASADALEKQFNQSSVKNAQDRADAITTINRDLGKINLAIQGDQNREVFDTIEKGYNDQVQAIRDRIIARATDIFNSGAKASEKKRQLDKLQNEGEQELLNEDLKRIDSELAANQRLYDQKLINEDAFNKKDKELRDQRFKDVQTLNDRELTAEQKREALKRQIRDAAFQIAGEYFAAQAEKQNQQIDQNFEEAKSYRDAEKQKRLDQASSAQEKDAIEKEYAEKDKEAERQRNIERQDVAKKQLAIEWALASIKAISTSSNIYEGLIKEAIVTAEYFLKLGVLNAQKFAGGGRIQPLSTGRITAAQNIPTQPNGDNILATVKAGEVILNKEQQRLAGGDAFFKMLRVPGFASGGYFGSQVQPPVFASQLRAESGGNNGIAELSAQMQLMMGMMTANNAAMLAESYKPVVLNPNAVTAAQSKNAKAVDVATL